MAISGKRLGILRDVQDQIFELVCDGATPEQWADWLRVPLEHAAGAANHDVVDKLLRAGANWSPGWRGCNGRTLLHAGAQGGNTGVISALLRVGADADKNMSTVDTGHTPLHCATLGGHNAAAKVLMMVGADVNILDKKNDGPLHFAIEGGNQGLAEHVLLSGADPNVRGSKGADPIHLAARRGLDETVRDLIHKGANQNSLSTEGRTPLRIAVYEDKVSTVQALLAGGADPNFPCPNSGTLLHVAARYDKAGVIPLLIEAGVNVEALGDKGQTPLFVASSFGSCAAMLTLLRLGASVHSKTNRGSTPLHGACMQGKVGAAEALLKWGADETITDIKNDRPRARMPDIAKAAEKDRPRLQRLARLLERAPQDRAWRRRGFIVLCHSHQNRLRLLMSIPREISFHEPSQEPPVRRSRRGRVKMEVLLGGSRGARGEEEASGAYIGRAVSGAGHLNTGSGLDGVVAWLMALTNTKRVASEGSRVPHHCHGIFREILGFL